MNQQTTLKKVPFMRPFIGEDEIEEVVSTLRSGWLTTGQKVKAFEEALVAYTGARHAVCLSSCSAALHLSLKILGIGPGDEVITTPLTFIATVQTIAQAGATPVLADIDPETFTIDPGEIAKKISPKTKAILPVHYGGHPCDMDAIISLAKKHDLFVIEDAAHAIGSSYRNVKIGNLDTDATCYSFYASKNLSIGEGGALVTHNGELARQARILSLHGMNRDAWMRYGDRCDWYYDILEDGHKYNMTDIQAAIGIHQLKKLDKMNQDRRRVAEMYHRELSGLSSVVLPVEKNGSETCWHLYPVRIRTETGRANRRNRLIEALKEKNIGTSVHFIPVVCFTYSKKLFHFREEDYPVTMRAFDEILSLPIFPQMTEEEVLYVTESIKEEVT